MVFMDYTGDGMVTKAGKLLLFWVPGLINLKPGPKIEKENPFCSEPGSFQCYMLCKH